MKLRGWIIFAIGIAACLGIAYGAYLLADFSWNQVVDYRGPYAESELPPTLDPLASRSGTTALAPGRTVYVIVDGLREDVSRALPNLNNLRAHGYDAVVRTAQPSLSFPNWTTLMSGAPQRISGVTTNWFEERVPVETLVDVALAAGRTVAVSAPTDFEMLYGVNRAGNVFLRDWTEGEYMTGEIVDHAITLAQDSDASLVIVHFPDIDEAGHGDGGATEAYRAMALRCDADLGRLVSALQGPDTTFIVASDHGHIDTGGHGGPEPVATDVPAVFAGPRVKPGTGRGSQDQVAPTVALLADLPAPRNATGSPLDIATGPAADLSRFDAQQLAAHTAYIRAVTSEPVNTADLSSGETARSAFDAATAKRLVSERGSRLPVALAIVVACLVVFAVVARLSWRALVAASIGAVVYYIVWNGSYFLLHGYRWSLSSFNSESYLKSFLNGRMTDAIIAGVVAAIVAAEVYLMTRPLPQRPQGAYRAGWLSLGAATVLVTQATLGLQVAWYLWYWGASVSWVIPDLALGFKYDLDLIQLTGLGAAAVLAPVVTYLIGRYHPIRRASDAP